MESPDDSASESITLGLKRKPAEFGSSRTSFKMARIDCERGMSTCCQGGCCYCCSRRSAVTKNHLNFFRSLTPQRIMFYSGGEWSDFPESVTSLLVKAFVDKKSPVEISISQTCYLFDFLSMVLINLENQRQRSVSWIDESEKCFFPTIFFDEDSFLISGCNNLNTSNMDVKVVARVTDIAGALDQSKVGSTPSKVIKAANSENRASPVSTEQAAPIHTVCPELVKLERDSKDFIAVMKTFLSGLSSLADPTCVTGIYRYTPKTSCALTEQKNFEELILSTRCCQGDANVRRGWFGASRERILQILLHGFGRDTEVSQGVAYGTGGYLMPENCSMASAKHCDVDENGAQYMVLCQVVVGNEEKVPAGPNQCSPSGPEFDSGADDLRQSTYCAVWSAHMATHIRPEFMVCFRLSPAVREYLAGLKNVKSNSNMATGNQENVPMNYPASRPRSPWIPFTLLFAEVKDKVSPLAMELLNLHHREFKSKMITRNELVKRMRLIVGDPVLISMLKKLQQNSSRKPW